METGKGDGMDHIEYPIRSVWDARREWFECLIEKEAGDGAYLVSEQACALIAEAQSVFCAGAWAAVIIIAVAVVDAQLRETEIPGFEGNTKKLIDATGANPALQRLRLRRNALIHVDPDNPALTVDDQWSGRTALEADAREAILLMFEAFYLSPAV
jgi:hypothetical protein